MPDTQQFRPEDQGKAIDNESFEKLRDRIKKGEISLTAIVKTTTALHLIVTYPKHMELLKWILENQLELKADINVQNNAKSTPLIMAACVGNMSAIKLLIEHGADLQAKTANKETARDILVRKFPHQVTLFDQAVKAYQDKKNSNQSLQDKQESLVDQSRFSSGSFSFLNFCIPNFLSNRKSKKEDKQVMTPLIEKKMQ